MKSIKIAALGTLAAIGMATAALAQQSNPQPRMTPEQHQQMMSGGGMMGHGNMMTMMNDPEMRQQMSQMMGHCERMMKQTGDQSAKASTSARGRAKS